MVLELGTCDPASVLPRCVLSERSACELVDGTYRYVAEACSRRRDERTWCLGGTCVTGLEFGRGACEVPSRCSPDVQEVEVCGLDGDGNPTFTPGPRCVEGEACVDGACHPSCTVRPCECPAEAAPACATNGRVYWNACQLACAGQAPAEGCASAWTFVEAAGAPARMRDLVPIGSLGLVLVLADDRRPEKTEHELVAFELGSLLSEPVAVWSDSGAGVYGEAVELPAGDALLLTEYGGLAFFGWVSASGYAPIPFPRVDQPIFSRPTGVADGDDAVIWLPGTISTANPARPDTLHYEAAWRLPTDLGREERGTFGLLPGVSGPALLRWDKRGRASLAELVREPTRLRPLWRDAVVGGDADVTWWRAGERIGFAAAYNSVPATLVDAWWADGCVGLRPSMTAHAEAQASTAVASGDVDGDGIDELAWLSGSKIYVFGRDDGGWPVLRGVVEDVGARAYELRALDFDADGRSELWVTRIEEAGPGTAYVLAP